MNIQEEQLIALNGPAVYSNKVICSVGDSVRISFLEADSVGDLHFRTAVSMDLNDAMELRKMLKRVLSKE